MGGVVAAPSVGVVVVEDKDDRYAVTDVEVVVGA